jgi:uncharacterized membrane protein
MKVNIGIYAFALLLAGGCAGARNMAETRERISEESSATGFRATGNEPSWNLEIEFVNDRIKFNTLAEKEIELTTTLPRPVRPGDLSLIKYSAKTPGGGLEVSMSREECIDSMSGDMYPYLVTVSVSGQQPEDYLEFKGCGQYLGEYRLNDIWILDRLNGVPVELPDSREYPGLQVDIAGKSIFGYGGCNRFQGRAEMIENKLVTGHITSTRMACADTQDIENKFLGALSGNILEFHIVGDFMRMTGRGSELIFTRAK